MTFEEAEAILARVTYKPGSEFMLSAIDWCRFAMRLRCRAPDANDANGATWITCDIPIEGHDLMVYSERDLFCEAERLCVLMERHEIQEWLKLDGVRFRAPHPEREEKVLLPGQPL